MTNIVLNTIKILTHIGKDEKTVVIENSDNEENKKRKMRKRKNKESIDKINQVE